MFVCRHPHTHTVHTSGKQLFPPGMTGLFMTEAWALSIMTRPSLLALLCLDSNRATCSVMYPELQRPGSLCVCLSVALSSCCFCIVKETSVLLIFDLSRIEFGVLKLAPLEGDCPIRIKCSTLLWYDVF